MEKEKKDMNENIMKITMEKESVNVVKKEKKEKAKEADDELLKKKRSPSIVLEDN